MSKVPILRFRQPEEMAIPFEVVRIEALPKIAQKPRPHRQAFYSIFWVTAGSGTHSIDFSEDDIQPHSLHFVGPGQIHYWDVSAELRGITAIFEASLFLRTGESRLLDEINFFHTLNGISSLNLSESDADWFNTRFEELLSEYEKRQQYGRIRTLIAGFEQVLIKAQRLAIQSGITQDGGTADNLLADRYIRLVEKHAIREHKVEWYANELVVTVSHLSKSIKSALGITAGEVLRDRIILEAKRLLIHTDLTAAEISHRLYFEDPSYFGRFFKRETAQTPKTFRNDFPIKYQNEPII